MIGRRRVTTCVMVRHDTLLYSALWLLLGALQRIVLMGQSRCSSASTDRALARHEQIRTWCTEYHREAVLHNLLIKSMLRFFCQLSATVLTRTKGLSAYCCSEVVLRPSASIGSGDFDCGYAQKVRVVVLRHFVYSRKFQPRNVCRQGGWISHRVPVNYYRRSSPRCAVP